MNKFTKGKWKYTEYVPEGVTLNDKQYIISAEFYDEDENVKDVVPDIALVKREDDARFIAAAMDMYCTLNYAARILCNEKATQNWRLLLAGDIIDLLKSLDGNNQEN